MSDARSTTKPFAFSSEALFGEVVVGGADVVELAPDVVLVLELADDDVDALELVPATLTAAVASAAAEKLPVIGPGAADALASTPTRLPCGWPGNSEVASLAACWKASNTPAPALIAL